MMRQVGAPALLDWRRQTGREVVSIIYRNFDPIGLLAPIAIKLMILLQKLSKAGVEWDQPLQDELAKESGTVLGEMVLMRDSLYTHRLKPAGGKGHPELCWWWSGGKLTVADCLYSRYKLKDTGSKNEMHSCGLLMGKARVAFVQN